MTVILGTANAGIIDPEKGLDNNGGDWHTLASEFAAFAQSQREDWTSPAAVESEEYRDALKVWLQERIRAIKKTGNLSLKETLATGERNPLLADKGTQCRDQFIPHLL